MSTKTQQPEHPASDGPAAEVLTLAEAAAYLRVSEDDVLAAVQRQQLPGRRISREWRFLRSALADWLSLPEDPEFWETHLGALRDDSSIDDLLEHVYRQRGRSMTEQA